MIVDNKETARRLYFIFAPNQKHPSQTHDACETPTCYLSDVSGVVPCLSGGQWNSRTVASNLTYSVERVDPIHLPRAQNRSSFYSEKGALSTVVCFLWSTAMHTCWMCNYSTEHFEIGSERTIFDGQQGAVLVVHLTPYFTPTKHVLRDTPVLQITLFITNFTIE